MSPQTARNRPTSGQSLLSGLAGQAVLPERTAPRAPVRPSRSSGR
ncbi:hypothetical protein [Streptomyces nitrosporeus]